MFANKPIIGLSGGIGSGKSFVAALFAKEGCLVLDSDSSVRHAYQDPEIKRALHDAFGAEALLPDGSVNRPHLAQLVFNNPAARARLESLIHPYVAQDRDRQMRDAANDDNVRAFVWDIPLLFDIGAHEKCDALVFVDADFATREHRVATTRNWPAGQLALRESTQFPLDTKRALSHYVVRNNPQDAASLPDQVRDVLSRILKRF